jgi:hypothetical protein
MASTFEVLESTINVIKTLVICESSHLYAFNIRTIFNCLTTESKFLTPLTWRLQCDTALSHFHSPFALTTYFPYKLFLCFNWAPRHESVLGKWNYSPTHSLTLALDGGEWSASHPGHFTARERAPCAYRIWGWVGPRAVLDAMVNRKIPSPPRESNPRTPIAQTVVQSYTDWAITALQISLRGVLKLHFNIKFQKAAFQ